MNPRCSMVKHFRYFFHLIQKAFVNTRSNSSWNAKKKTFFQVFCASKYILEACLSVLKVSEETIWLHKTPLNAQACSEAAESEDPPTFAHSLTARPTTPQTSQMLSLLQLKHISSWGGTHHPELGTKEPFFTKWDSQPPHEWCQAWATH